MPRSPATSEKDSQKQSPETQNSISVNMTSNEDRSIQYVFGAQSLPEWITLSNIISTKLLFLIPHETWPPKVANLCPKRPRGDSRNPKTWPGFIKVKDWAPKVSQIVLGSLPVDPWITKRVSEWTLQVSL